jgi:hypothetical protein
MTRKKSSKNLKDLKSETAIPESDQEEIRGGFITHIPGQRPAPPPPPPPKPPINDRTPPSWG